IRIASHCNRSAKWLVVPAPARNLSRIRASGQYRDDFNEVSRHVRLKGNRVPLYPHTIPQGYSTNGDVACPSNGAFIALFLIARQIDAANVANPIPTFECGHRAIPRSYWLAKRCSVPAPSIGAGVVTGTSPRPSRAPMQPPLCPVHRANLAMEVRNVGI